MNNFLVQGFTGEYRDPVIGGYPLGNGYRTYLPGLMRFSAPDTASPFGDGGINPYVYCGGDPINRIDPTGHFFLFTWLSDVAKAVFSPEKNPLINFIKQEAVAAFTSLPTLFFDPVGAVLGFAASTVSNISVAVGDQGFADKFDVVSMFGLAVLDPSMEFFKAAPTVVKLGEDIAPAVLRGVEREGENASAGAGRVASRLEEDGAHEGRAAAHADATAESTASRTSHQEAPSGPKAPEKTWGGAVKAASKAAVMQGAGIGIQYYMKAHPKVAQVFAGGVVVASAFSLGYHSVKGLGKVMRPTEDMFTSPATRRPSGGAQQRLVDRPTWED
ncbi:hypothetical protein CAL14_12355 [Bordetella genomosp. 9]|uniref:RHS repeat-associated core domain-containing protein n=1 Tax=Bordetella genomosp. 9 TaxID=1416803 RepID=UPI000A29699F|nr:RHS repeat-associated core domain-containing protein [Bordetella genomosp. 9]ARP90984.1 hypothetical protein CAL14_12355 [Bordetella genomosp. 9]